MPRTDASGITSRNGLRADPDKARAWQRRGAEQYAARRRQRLSQQPALARRQPWRRRATAADWPTWVRTAVAHRSGGLCERCGHETAVHLHHRKLRRHGDHHTSNALHVCPSCHSTIHGDTTASYRAGWLLHAHEAPAENPALITRDDRSTFELLTDSGSYAPTTSRRRP